MADIKKNVGGSLDGDDDGERGTRGRRGPRGHAGQDGQAGATGPTGSGATGATGPTGAGSAPTGDPNTQAYFGAGGALTDDVDATMTLTDWIQRTSPGGAQAIRINRAIRSVAIGDGSAAAGTNSAAIGNLASASREGQWAFSSGQGGLSAPAAGNSQVDIVTMVGQTPGIGVTESVELVLGSGAGPLVLQDGKDYAFTVTAAVGAVQAGPTRVSRTFLLYFNVRRAAGLSVIAASGVGQSFGDVATNDWTLVASIGAVPDRVVLTFTTGAIISAARVTAEVRFVEISF